ncbi:MAG: anti-sigma factor antagonist [Terriglobales bacterium]
MSMSYVIRQVGDVTVLDLGGRISLGEAPASGAAGDALLHEVVRNTAKTGSRKILLNLREVTYIDSSGLGELVSCNTSIYNQGGDMKVCNTSPRVNDLLVITSLHAVLDVYADEEAALRAFGEQKKGTSAA